MRRILSGPVCVFLILVVAQPLLAQGKCSGKGTFARGLSGGGVEYCWHGKHYTESNAPANVKAFFAEAVAKRKAANKQSSGSQPTASRARTTRAAAGPSVAVSTKPVAAPVGTDLIASIETGTDRDAVIAKLGRPHGSISNLGEEGTEEAWSYKLPDGGIAKVRLDQGKVIAVQLPQ